MKLAAVSNFCDVKFHFIKSNDESMLEWNLDMCVLENINKDINLLAYVVLWLKSLFQTLA